MSFAFGPRRAIYVDISEARRGPPNLRFAADEVRIRAPRPGLSLALRPALQLRADLGPSRRLDLLGALRGGLLFDAPGLRFLRSGPRRRRHHFLRRRPQGPRALCHVGAAQRDGCASAAPSSCRATSGGSCGSRTCSVSAATRSTATPLFTKLQVKALDGHPTPATPFVRLCHRRLRRGRGHLHRARVRRAGSLRRGRAAGAHHRGRGRPDAGPRGGGPRRRRDRLARQRRPARRLEPGLHRLDRVCREGTSRATTSSGIPPSSLPARLERHLRRRTASISSRSLPPSAGRSTLETASRPPSSTARQGLAVRHRGPASHGAGHELAPRASTRLCAADGRCGGRAAELRGADQRCGAVEHGTVMLEDVSLGGSLRASRAGWRSGSRRRERSRRAWWRHASGSTGARGRARGSTLRPLRAGRARWQTTRRRAAVETGHPRRRCARSSAEPSVINKASGGAFCRLRRSFGLDEREHHRGQAFRPASTTPRTNQRRACSRSAASARMPCPALSGISTFGQPSASARSYGAFMAPLGHIAARLHAIGDQAAHGGTASYRPIDPRLRARRAEDRRGRADARRSAGPAAAAGQLPARHGDHAHALGAPGDLAAARRGARRGPAVIAPFVTRPNEKVLDRAALGLAPASVAIRASTCCGARGGRPTGRSSCRRAP